MLVAPALGISFHLGCEVKQCMQLLGGEIGDPQQIAWHRGVRRGQHSGLLI
jgi:hypothetical protein